MDSSSDSTSAVERRGCGAILMGLELVFNTCMEAGYLLRFEEICYRYTEDFLKVDD